MTHSARLSVALCALTLALLLPGSLISQQPADSTAPPADDLPTLLDRYDRAVQEAHELEERLEPIRQEAVESSDRLRRAGEALREELLAAYDEHDPGHAERIARAERISAEARAAYEAGDHARMQELEREADEIRGRLAAAQAAVFARPDITELVEGYQLQLMARMSEIDPEAVRLLDQLDRINGEIEKIEGRLRALLATSGR